MGDDASESRFREGAVIAGKYALTHALGRGGMGLVIAATHLQLERPVAIKFLLPEHLAKPDVVARFTREARSAAKIQSDHVAHVLDVGIDEGTPYMVMEYLEGEDLKQVLSRRGALSVEEAVRHVMQACEALAEAHALGIVHRDLKPANLFLASRPHGRSILKVLDFGISKIMNPATETELTMTSRAVGSPSYMSPEQLTASRSLDGRADVWALGVVLYELLTKRRPFYAESMPSLVALILKGKFEKLDALRPELPPGLVDAVHRCLAIEAEDRFPGVVELAQALATFAPTESISAVDGLPRASMPSRSSIAPEEASAHGQTGIASVVTPLVKPARPPRQAMMLASGGLGVLAVLTVGGFLRLHAPEARSRGPATAAVLVVPRLPEASAVPAPSLPPPVVVAVEPTRANETEPAVPAPVVSSAPIVSKSHAPVGARPLPPTAAPPRSVPSAAAARPPPSASASAAPCRLVSYFDALGDRHFKQECP